MIYNKSECLLVHVCEKFISTCIIEKEDTYNLKTYF